MQARRRTHAAIGLTSIMVMLTACGGEIERPPEHDSLVQGPIQEVLRPSDDPHAAANGCLSCHDGIEMIRGSDTQMMQEILMVATQSGTNNRCVVCHGGNGDVRAEAGMDTASDAYQALADQAHAGTATYFETNPGPKTFYPDPGSPWINEHTCGVCHAWEVKTQWQSLMMTEAGKIQGTLWGFGAMEEGREYEHRFANYDVATLTGDEVVGTAAYRKYMDALAAKEPNVFVEAMSQVAPAPEGGADVIADPTSAAFTYIRGECQRCHLGVGGAQRHGDFRGLGCSACHIPYGNAGVYEGGDTTLEGTGRPLVHSIQSGPGAPVQHGDLAWSGVPVETCTTCHNRGRRIGVSYQGLMETPYDSGWNEDGSGQQKLHGKTYLKLHADLHKEKGFLCQDCHTTLDVHSSGKLIGAITGAVEVECTDCHGTPFNYPWELPLGYGDEYEEKPKEGEPRGVAQTLPEYMKRGDYPDTADGYLLTARGNPFGNVVRDGEHVRVHLASGAIRDLLPLKLLVEEDRLSDEARVAMVEVSSHMERMECFACHATWAPQCYGCHIKVDYREEDAHYDWIQVGDAHGADGKTPEFTGLADHLKINGKIKETRSYLRWEEPALAVNGEGRISPVIPGCQTSVTVIDKDGNPVVTNKIARIPNVEGAGPEGQCGIDHSPLHPHTVQKRARTCESCHADPKALGYGIGGGLFYDDPSKDHVVDLMTGDGKVIPETTSPQMVGVPELEGDWSRFVTEEGKQIQTVGHHFSLSRPLNDEERAHMTRDGVCVSCHKEIPEGNLATSMMHHVGGAIGMIPHTSEEHDALTNKIMLFAAWGQLLGGALAGVVGMALFFRWRSRRAFRRAKKKK